ncbi:hypothetical protein Y032_0552g3348 [Ancylostoma ceylanicum]|uniref:glucuronosyltransferase n=1 Tax=Ancylostoma ceylanicum TaxID=53326 RepID=A0A016WQK5_9BILA|nr:hypothetical protein Y032_0552g3348 [Ancylostoma ceylanicum]
MHASARLSVCRYSLNAKRLSLMVRKKPVSPTHLLVKWTEFLAEFQTLDNFIPAGNDLNFFQYFSLDVIGVLLLVVLIVMVIVYKTIALVLRTCCCWYRKEKKG